MKIKKHNKEEANRLARRILDYYAASGIATLGTAVILLIDGIWGIKSHAPFWTAVILLWVLQAGLFIIIQQIVDISEEEKDAINK